MRCSVAAPAAAACINKRQPKAAGGRSVDGRSRRPRQCWLGQPPPVCPASDVCATALTSYLHHQAAAARHGLAAAAAACCREGAAACCQAGRPQDGLAGGTRAAGAAGADGLRKKRHRRHGCAAAGSSASSGHFAPLRIPLTAPGLRWCNGGLQCAIRWGGSNPCWVCVAGRPGPPPPTHGTQCMHIALRRWSHSHRSDCGGSNAGSRKHKPHMQGVGAVPRHPACLAAAVLGRQATMPFCIPSPSLCLRSGQSRETVKLTSPCFSCMHA